MRCGFVLPLCLQFRIAIKERIWKYLVFILISGRFSVPSWFFSR